MLRPRFVQVLTASVVTAAAVVMAVLPQTASTASIQAPTRTAPKNLVTHTVVLSPPSSFTPVAPTKGGHDLYHCFLLDPKVTTNQMIVSSLFTPGAAKEVHHEISYWVPPSQAALARQMDNGGKGWTCFGGPGLAGKGNIADLGSSPWLSGWSPGRGIDILPAGVGVPLPVGSLIVMQVHYNLLQGSAPDKSSVALTMTPQAGSGLQPEHIDLYPAAIDIPCPKGITGPLCTRSASLKDIGQRFGANAIGFDNLLEAICNGGHPVASSTTSCSWPIGGTQYVQRITAHMHLLGSSMTVTLDPGTAKEKVLLSVPNYNFDNQRAYDLSSPVKIQRGDTIKVTCTFNPTLRQLIPQLKSLPPRYILWGDGSSDEMCLAIVGATPAP